MLTTKKSVGSLPALRLASRYPSDSSSSDSSLRYSSSSYAISDSMDDSSIVDFTRPSYKRCRSPTSYVPAIFARTWSLISIIKDDACESIKEDVLDYITADGAVDVTYETLEETSKGHRITGVDLEVTTMTKRISALERDNMRLKGMIIGVDDAYDMKWKVLMKLVTEVYCPRNEIQKMETELWNLKVKSNDLTAYNHGFQELTILQDAIRVANNLIDQKLKGYAIKNAENKRRFKSSSRDNRI
nr:reverse transcriptase domain-containing protein [Tanacetum cinerariifolium]